MFKDTFKKIIQYINEAQKLASSNQRLLEQVNATKDQAAHWYASMNLGAIRDGVALEEVDGYISNIKKAAKFANDETTKRNIIDLANDLIKHLKEFKEKRRTAPAMDHFDFGFEALINDPLFQKLLQVLKSDAFLFYRYGYAPNVETILNKMNPPTARLMLQFALLIGDSDVRAVASWALRQI